MNIFKSIFKTTLFSVFAVMASVPGMQGVPASDGIQEYLGQLTAQEQLMLQLSHEEANSQIFFQKLTLLEQLCVKINAMCELLVPFFLQRSAAEQEQLAGTITKILFNELGTCTVCASSEAGILTCTNRGYMTSYLSEILTSEEVAALENIAGFNEIKGDILTILNQLSMLPKLREFKFAGEYYLLQVEPRIEFRIECINGLNSSMLTALQNQAPMLATKFQELENALDELRNNDQPVPQDSEF